MNEQTRVALVTGASRGLGLVIARVLASRGFNLVIGGRDGGSLDFAAADLSLRSWALSVHSRRLMCRASDVSSQSTSERRWF